MACALAPMTTAQSRTLAQATAAATDQATATCASYNEAPMLTDQVKAGKLPAVKDRLPEHPMVEKPAEKTGIYDGTMLSLYDG